MAARLLTCQVILRCELDLDLLVPVLEAKALHVCAIVVPHHSHLKGCVDLHSSLQNFKALQAWSESRNSGTSTRTSLGELAHRVSC